MAFDRSALRKGIAGATQASAARADEGPGFKTYLKSCGRPRYGKIPEGTLILDIIPFVMGSDFNEHYKAGNTYYNVDVWVHNNVGPTGDTVVCPSATFGKPCPICEERERRARNGEDNDTRIKPLRPKRRCVYNIWVHDPARTEQNKGVQLFEIAHFSFESELLTISRDPLTGEFTIFADPDQGKTVCFDRKGTGRENTRYSGFRFLDRKAPIPDAILEQAVSLETVVTVLPYADIAAKFYGDDQEQQPGDDTTSNVPNNPAIAAENDPYDYSTAAAAPPPTKDDDLGPGCPSEQAATAPPKAALRQRPAPTPQKTAPVATAAPEQRTAIATCPVAEYGGIFGETTDKFPQCTTCSLWDDCTEQFDALPF